MSDSYDPTWLLVLFLVLAAIVLLKFIEASEGPSRPEIMVEIKSDCDDYGHVMLEGEKYECTLVNRIKLTSNDLKVIQL